MLNCTPDYEIKQVKSSEICVDPLYQRELDERRVKRILKNYNPYLVNIVKVSKRDGKLWVFDGQHTIAVQKCRHNGDCLIECKIFKGLTRLEEMELFIQQNGDSAAVGTNAKFRALYNNGDPQITDMVRCCESIGVLVDFGKSKGTNKVIALKTLSNMYVKLGAADFTDCMSIIKGAWHGHPESFSREILDGVSRFYALYSGEFNKSRFINKLSKAEPSTIVREGKASIYTGADKYARIIFNLYNQSAQTSRLQDKF